MKLYKVQINKYVKISNKSNKDAVLVITNIKDLKKFNKKYGRKNNPNDYLFIYWNKVKLDYSGIEFKNYSKIYDKLPRNKDFLWFSTFDINSGVIWNDKCVNIEKIDPIK